MGREAAESAALTCALGRHRTPPSSYGGAQRDKPRTASASRLDGKIAKDRSRILDVLLFQLTKLLAARLGADQGQEV